MSRGCILAIDQGTHATRAAVFDGGGRLLAQASAGIALRRHAGGRVEQNPAEILASVDRVVAEVLHRAGRPAPGIAGVGLATQRSSVLAWERRGGRALSPVLSWQDTRVAGALGAFTAHAATIRERTGLRLSAHYGAGKLRWLLQQQPGLRERAAAGELVLGPLAAFVLQHLSAGAAVQVDEANAARTLLYNLRQRRWDPWLLQLFELPASALPQPRPVCADYGRLQGHDAPICALDGDQGAALYAWGAPRPGEILVNIGTGAFVLLALDGDRPPDGWAATGLLLGATASSQQGLELALEGTVNGAGAALAWAGEHLQLAHSGPLLGQALLGVQAPPLFINTVGGLGSPWWRPGPAPGFAASGRPDRDPAAALAGVAESILFLIARNIELLQSLRPAIDSIRISGGLAQSDGLCQRLADVAGLPVRRPAQVEATVRGIAWLAAGRPAGWGQAPAVTCFAPRRDAGLSSRYRRFLALLEAAATAPLDGD